MYSVEYTITGAELCLMCKPVLFWMCLRKYKILQNMPLMDCGFWAREALMINNETTGTTQTRSRSIPLIWQHIHCTCSVLRAVGQGRGENIKTFQRHSWHLGCHIWNYLDCLQCWRIWLIIVSCFTVDMIIAGLKFLIAKPSEDRW